MLEVTDLTVGYGSVRALRGVSIKVEEATLVGIVGANGAGKSTLINAVCGVLRPESGRVLLEGRDITGLPPHRIAELGAVQVPEGRSLFSEMSVRDNLMVAAQARKAWPDRTQSLETVHSLFPRLKERASQLAGTLSGGEAQMLAIGRALMVRPRLLLLDEASLGLAPVVLSEVYEGIRRLKASGLTLILVEQNARHCLSVADYAYVLRHGRVALQGKGSDLLADAVVDSYFGHAVSDKAH